MKISSIITPVDCKNGAPMGRPNVGGEPITVYSGKNNRIIKKNQAKIYQKRVRLIDGYDMGGAYWGAPNNLYVRFTADLKFIQYFRIN